MNSSSGSSRSGDHRPERAVDDVAAGHGDRHPRQRADDLRAERDAAEAPSALAPKMPAASPPQAPQTPCSGQTPSTSSIFQRFCVIVNRTTNSAPATRPVASAPSGCMTSEPAQTATSPASGPLWTKPGSLRPATSAAIVPPDIASSELTATRPEILSIVCADITLNPNQPTDRIHAPSARKGIDDGGCAAIPPSFV